MKVDLFNLIIMWFLFHDSDLQWDLNIYIYIYSIIIRNRDLASGSDVSASPAECM